VLCSANPRFVERADFAASAITWQPLRGSGVDSTERQRPVHGRVSMADLTERQKQEYWRYNVTLTTILLAIWFVVTYLISGLWAGYLNQYSFLGFPLGYYMAAQGSLAIFVIEIAVYAHLMNKKDVEYGIREEG
jgi:putative solute:sodium symporter small subunit